MTRKAAILLFALLLTFCYTTQALACGYGNKLLVCRGTEIYISSSSHYDKTTNSTCATDKYGSYCSEMCSECFRVYETYSNLHTHRERHSVCDKWEVLTYCPRVF